MNVVAQSLEQSEPGSEIAGAAASDARPAWGRPRAYEAPGPGSWSLDAEHCERPHSRWTWDLFPAMYTEGFRAGMARYGALLDTIELGIVNGFAYMALRPVGAQPDATGTPPRLLFWLVTRLHPEIRRRVRRTAEVFRTKLWREDTREFFEEVMPRCIAEFERIQALRIGALDDEELIRHLSELVELAEEQFRDHFLRGTAPMLPVGDFVVHAREWTGCSAEEAIALLTGYSPYSVEAVQELDAVSDALRMDADARRILESSGEAGAVLDELVARGGAVGESLAHWLDRVGQRIVTGHDVADLRGVELPATLVRAIRAQLTAPPRAAVRALADEATARLRARVPEQQRAAFDELLDEARFVHPLRDAHSMIDFWAMGLLRRSLLEAGRRLHARGVLHEPEHVVELTHAEILQMLRGGPGPTPDEVAEHVAWRTSHTMADAPMLLGPPPGAPPPAEWLPGPAARAARAMNTYLALMFMPERGAAEPEVTGTAASGGRHTGTARLVLTPAEFSKVQRGDVLVARITTPAYNVLLPLLGAVVTDRGGLLSHPAIVSREYGIPGVVGARDATTRIPDGARVEVDGDAGTVRVLAP
jgi:rifampicin phosphotransferase